MKGFFGALCIFLLWTAACIYYVSTSKLDPADPIAQLSSQDDTDETEPLLVKSFDASLSGGLDSSIAVLDDSTVVDTISPNTGNPEINTIARTESQLLADEIMKSIAISDTVDFDRDEPELKFENNIEISSGPAVTSNEFYPYYKNTDLIIDEKLVEYAKELRQLLRDDSSKMVTIIGHTDNVGNGKDNFDTGLKKARQVKWYLTARRGIPRTKIKAISKGEEKPIESNNSEWGRKKNNRVEIIVE